MGRLERQVLPIWSHDSSLRVVSEPRLKLSDDDRRVELRIWWPSDYVIALEPGARYLQGSFLVLREVIEIAVAEPDVDAHDFPTDRRQRNEDRDEPLVTVRAPSSPDTFQPASGSWCELLELDTVAPEAGGARPQSHQLAERELERDLQLSHCTGVLLIRFWLEETPHDWPKPVEQLLIVDLQ